MELTLVWRDAKRTALSLGHCVSGYARVAERKANMGLMRFGLDGIGAFRNQDPQSRAQHFCVECARKGRDEYILIPFLRDQLDMTLSDCGKDLGAVLFCDKCERVIATYYPDTFWAALQRQEPEDSKSLLFRKF